MERFLSQQRYIVVRGLLKDPNGKVLIMKDEVRYRAFPAEYYNLPGGEVPFGKDPAETLEELFIEQTRIPVIVKEPFRTVHRLSPQQDTQVVEILYRVENVSRGGVRVSRSVLWIEPNDTGFFFSSRTQGSMVQEDVKGSWWSKVKRGVMKLLKRS